MPMPYVLSSLATPFLFSLACAGSVVGWMGNQSEVANTGGVIVDLFQFCFLYNGS